MNNDIKAWKVYFLNVVRPSRIVTPIMQTPAEWFQLSTYPPSPRLNPNQIFPTSGVFRAGLAVYTKLYADQFAADNIRMNNILPGFIDSLPAKTKLSE